MLMILILVVTRKVLMNYLVSREVCVHSYSQEDSTKVARILTPSLPFNESLQLNISEGGVCSLDTLL